MKVDGFTGPGGFDTDITVTHRNKKFEAPVTAELYDVLRYVRGQNTVDYIYEIIQSFCEMVWANPFIKEYNYSINWSKWIELKHGFIIRLAMNRMNLLGGQDLKLNQLANLSGLDKSTISRDSKINKNHIEKNGLTKYVDNDFCKEYLKSKEVVIEGEKKYFPYKNIDS